MEPQPIVSVVIPVYNGENYLDEAVQSVFSQTYQNLEILIVDDGSRDNTWNLIQSYGEHVRGIYKENGGVSSALNAGIRQARGEFIAWLSHDDLFYPEKIERQVRFLLDHPEFGACYTDFEIIDTQRRRIAMYRAPWYPSEELPLRFLRDMHINGSTVLFRKSCFQTAGWFNEKLAHTQDLEMWLRIADHSPFGHLGEVLLKSRSHPEQGSLNFAFQITQEQALFQELYQRLGPGKYFPKLNAMKDADLFAARSHELFADEVFRYRRWYRFALEQYRQSYRVQRTSRVAWKMLRCRLAIAILGDEEEALTLVKRARITMSLGNPRKARQISARMLQRHPLRLDAWAVWFGTWVPRRGFELLRQVKRALR